MKNKVVGCFLLVLLAMGQGCRRSDRIGPVSHVHVQNLHGGARISYRLPPGDSLQYVVATYMTASGRQRRVRASFYSHHLIISGLTDTSACRVQLRAVGRGGTISEPVEVVIHPLLPPIVVAARTIGIHPTTGGVRVSLTNPTRAYLTVTVVARDSAGGTARLHRFTSDSSEQAYLIHGWPASAEAIGAYLRGPNGLHSDTVFAALDNFSWDVVGRLTNSIFPIRFDRYDGHRWGTPAGWTVNRAARNHHGYGGLDGHHVPKGGYFSLEVWDTLDSLINGKIYQTLRLPPGRYIFGGYFQRGTDHGYQIKPYSSVYLIVAQGRSLPDLQHMGEALGHARLAAPMVGFILADTTIVTVGILANYRESHNFFRLPSLSLTKIK